jgi:lipoyl(octanoyl) transferase
LDRRADPASLEHVAGQWQPVIRPLGRVPYTATLDAMRAYTAQRDAWSPDELWLLEHPSVYTLGQAGRPEHLLEDHGIELIRTERGGQITYHGPGQLVMYTLIDLKRIRASIRGFVTHLEAAALETLATYNVSGERRTGAPGVYVRRDGTSEKIAALGLKVSQGRCYHGISLNVAMDLRPFEWIDPCGYPGLRCTDLKSLGVQASTDEVGQRLACALIEQMSASEKS